MRFLPKPREFSGVSRTCDDEALSRAPPRPSGGCRNDPPRVLPPVPQLFAAEARRFGEGSPSISAAPVRAVIMRSQPSGTRTRNGLAHRDRFIVEEVREGLQGNAERWPIRRSAVFVIATCGVLWSLILTLISLFL